MRRKKARPKAKRFIPTRLLDISGPPESPIKVVETATTTIQGPYCSLSHCWGLLDFKECTLRDYNKKHFTTVGVAWNLLTPNFQQAIEIARFLDVSYMWIDSMCILQGSAEDWEHEASRMHLVYRNSYCNIAIVDSADKNGGAYRNRVPENIVPTLYAPQENSPMFGGKKWRILPKDMWESELLQSYLYVRAWVFQGMLSISTVSNTLNHIERMLAPRILHFAKNQVFWDCPSLSACEALPAGLPRPMDTAAGPDRHWRGRLQIDSSDDLAGSVDQALSAYWQTAVRKYTSCNITNRADKLIALWGIAKLVKDAMYVEYAEGLWEENLEDQLCWRVAECKLERRPITPANRKIPSWSWASMDGEIIVADRLSDKKHWTVTDHNGRHLTLDLVGVKRYARPTGPQTDEPAPFLQRRVKSDSVVQTKRLKDTSQVDSESHQSASSASKEIDNDAEPALHSRSIPIQGYVNTGMLTFDKTRRTWLLHLRTGADLDIEAYPDTIPGPPETPHHSQFVIMSAKKVARPRLEVFCNSPESINNDDEVVIEGLGILVETVDNTPGHFRRTGALRFRVADKEEFHLLLSTTVSEKLASKDFDTKRGRKFWLD
jgi:hypothetical protein